MWMETGLHLQWSVARRPPLPSSASRLTWLKHVTTKMTTLDAHTHSHWTLMRSVFFVAIDWRVQLQFWRRANYFLGPLQFLGWVEVILFVRSVCLSQRGSFIGGSGVVVDDSPLRREVIFFHIFMSSFFSFSVCVCVYFSFFIFSHFLVLCVYTCFVLDHPHCHSAALFFFPACTLDVTSTVMTRMHVRSSMRAHSPLSGSSVTESCAQDTEQMHGKQVLYAATVFDFRDLLVVAVAAFNFFEFITLCGFIFFRSNSV